jgi:hypothetical protein
MFGMCSFFLLVCLACQRQFASIVHQEQAGSHFNEDEGATPKAGAVEFTKLAVAGAEGEAAAAAGGVAATS